MIYIRNNYLSCFFFCFFNSKNTELKIRHSFIWMQTRFGLVLFYILFYLLYSPLDIFITLSYLKRIVRPGSEVHLIFPSQQAESSAR